MAAAVPLTMASSPVSRGFARRLPRKLARRKGSSGVLLFAHQEPARGRRRAWPPLWAEAAPGKARCLSVLTLCSYWLGSRVAATGPRPRSPGEPRKLGYCCKAGAAPSPASAGGPSGQAPRRRATGPVPAG
jgi:hypothetical protein